MRTISHAVALLGFEQVRLLILGIALFEADAVRDPLAVANRNLVWEHSFSCGKWAKAIGKKLGYQPLEEAFIGGLLHDIGKVALAVSAPVEFAAARELIKGKDMASWEAEQASLGIDHMEAGGLIAQRWSFPEILQDCIALHHSDWPAALPEGRADEAAVRRLIAVVRVANSASQIASARAHPTDMLTFDDMEAVADAESIISLADQVSLLVRATGPMGPAGSAGRASEMERDNGR